MSKYDNIFDAAGKGCLEDIDYFVEQKDIDVDEKCKMGYTPIEYALLNENVEAIKYLVSEGAAIQPHWLIKAAGLKKGSLEIVKLFVENGIDVNYRDSGICPLHIAASNKDIEVGKFLISKGADINSIAGSGYTPLQLAKKHGNTELVKYISEHKRKLIPMKIVKTTLIVIGILIFLWACFECM